MTLYQQCRDCHGSFIGVDTREVCGPCLEHRVIQFYRAALVHLGRHRGVRNVQVNASRRRCVGNTDSRDGYSYSLHVQLRTPEEVSIVRKAYDMHKVGEWGPTFEQWSARRVRCQWRIGSRYAGELIACRIVETWKAEERREEAAREKTRQDYRLGLCVDKDLD